jgi:hypothetical protein
VSYDTRSMTIPTDPGGQPHCVVNPGVVTNSAQRINCLNYGYGTITDGGHNIQFPGTDCGATIPSVDPLLDP